jgi:hypothetical protein
MKIKAHTPEKLIKTHTPAQEIKRDIVPLPPLPPAQVFKPLPPLPPAPVFNLNNDPNQEEDIVVGYGSPYAKRSFIRFMYCNYGRRIYIHPGKTLPFFDVLLKKEIKKFNKDNIDDSKIILLYNIYDSRNDDDFKHYLLITRLRSKDSELIDAIDKFLNHARL